MPSVRVKFTGSTDIPKDAGSLLFRLTLIPFVRIFLLPEKIVKLILATDDAVNEFHSATNTEKLLKHGFTIILDREYSARCTVIGRKVENSLLDRAEQDLIDSINSENYITILKLTKIQKYKLLKVKCSTPKEAEDLKTKGIKCSSIIIPPRDIDYERFSEITQCYRCYGFNHKSSSCKKEQVCSKCGDNGHFHLDCKNPTIKCVNCKEAHYAVSYKCKVKKLQVPVRLISSPTLPTTPNALLLPTPSHVSYASATSTPRTTLHPTPIPTPTATTSIIQKNTTVTDQYTDAKITTIVRISQVLSNGDRAKFLQYVQDGLEENTMPTIKFPTSYTNGPAITFPHIPIDPTETVKKLETYMESLQSPSKETNNSNPPPPTDSDPQPPPLPPPPTQCTSPTTKHSTTLPTSPTNPPNSPSTQPTNPTPPPSDISDPTPPTPNPAPPSSTTQADTNTQNTNMPPPTTPVRMKPHPPKNKRKPTSPADETHRTPKKHTPLVMKNIYDTSATPTIITSPSHLMIKPTPSRPTTPYRPRSHSLTPSPSALSFSTTTQETVKQTQIPQISTNSPIYNR